MERRKLGAGGADIGVIGICPAGPERDALAARAREAGCSIVDGRLPEGSAAVRYPLLDQLEANRTIPRLVREGKGIVAVHVFAGGRLFEQAALLRGLVKPGRTLAQAAIQFVLANESVSAACVRVSTRAHLEEALAAPDAPALGGSDLELIFEAWAHRNDG